MIEPEDITLRRGFYERLRWVIHHLIEDDSRHGILEACALTQFINNIATEEYACDALLKHYEQHYQRSHTD